MGDDYLTRQFDYFIVVAAALGANEIQIWTDVDGVGGSTFVDQRTVAQIRMKKRCAPPSGADPSEDAYL